MLKPKLNAILLCEKVEVVDGKANIYGVFDNMNSDGFPAIAGSLVIFIHLDIEKGLHRGYFEIKREDDNKIILSTEGEKVEFPVESEINRHQLIHRIKNLIIEKEGKYMVNVYIDNKLFATNYFFAKKN